LFETVVITSKAVQMQHMENLGHLSMTRFPSLKRMPVHMSQNSASVGWVYGPNTSLIL